MSLRIDKTWVVVGSIENPGADRCVDLFQRQDGRFGFEEFRRDVEARGRGPGRMIQSSRSVLAGANGAASTAGLRWPATDGGVRREPDWWRSRRIAADARVACMAPLPVRRRPG